MSDCLERKRLLLGGEKCYQCNLILNEPNLRILKYTIAQPVQVGSLHLRPGTITYGFYWPDRPYTLYKWISPDGMELGNYFNVADSVVFSAGEISWRDLALDILVFPDGSCEILDEDELNNIRDEDMLKKIEQTKGVILQDYRVIIEIASQKLRETAGVGGPSTF